MIHSMRSKKFDEAIDIVQMLFKTANEENDNLRSELAALKEEKWRDEELQKIQKQLEDARSDMSRGFPITKDELEQINKWKKSHDIKIHKNPEGYHGTAGGGYTYEFYPTGIGTFASCYCNTCRDKARLLAYANGFFDSKVYNDYMRSHDAECSFQEAW